MELATLSRNYGDFYAPAFAVRLGRRRSHARPVVAVSQVEVDLVLGAASRFSFTVTDSYSHKLHAFKTGRGDDVLDCSRSAPRSRSAWAMATPRSTPIAVSGMITEITTSFPEGGSPELSVAGYDHGFPLTIGKNSRTWTKSARQRRGARDRELQQPRRDHRDHRRRSTRRSSRTRRATGSSSRSSPTATTSSSTSTSAGRCTSASRTTRRRRSCGSCTARGC